MGVWTTDPKTGKSVWRDEFPDTPEGQAAAQKSTDQRSQQQSNSGTSTYNTGQGGNATTTGSQANSGTNFGYDAGGSGTTAADRTKSIYEWRDGEDVNKWMQRVFQMGARDFGGALSPDSSNPYNNTPYSQWFQKRYGDVVAPNLMLAQLLGNAGQGQDPSQYLEQGMQGFMQGGAGRGFGTGDVGASRNLGELSDIINSVANGNQAGLSPTQVAMAKQLGDNPYDVLGMFNAQVSGGLGANPYAARYVNDLGQRMASEYYMDPVGNAPNTHGQFLTNLLNKLNMR